MATLPARLQRVVTEACTRGARLSIPIQAVLAPVVHFRKPRSRRQRWRDAVAELVAIQADCGDAGLPLHRRARSEPAPPR